MTTVDTTEIGPEDDKTIIIIAVVVAVVLVVTICIIVVVYCFCCKRNKGDKTEKKDVEKFDNPMFKVCSIRGVLCPNTKHYFL